MECPTCHQPMRPGEISLDVTAAEVVLGLAGLAELTFREKNTDPVNVMGVSDSRPGLRCKDCRTFVIIDDFEQTESACLECHTAMPAGVNKCPRCGWSYLEMT